MKEKEVQIKMKAQKTNLDVNTLANYRLVVNISLIFTNSTISFFISDATKLSRSGIYTS